MQLLFTKVKTSRRDNDPSWMGDICTLYSATMDRETVVFLSCGTVTCAESVIMKQHGFTSKKPTERA